MRTYTLVTSKTEDELLQDLLTVGIVVKGQVTLMRGLRRVRVLARPVQADELRRRGHAVLEVKEGPLAN